MALVPLPRCCSSSSSLLHPPPLTFQIVAGSQCYSSLAFSFSSDSAANQSSTHALRNKLLMISAFVVAVADPNALFILRSCSKSKETRKKERKKESPFNLLLDPNALLIFKKLVQKKERKKERKKEVLFVVVVVVVFAGSQCSFDFKGGAKERKNLKAKSFCCCCSCCCCCWIPVLT